MTDDPTGIPAYVHDVEARGEKGMREARLTADHREALDALRASPIPGPTGKPPKELEDLTVEELKARLKAQTTDSQAYMDEYGLARRQVTDPDKA